MPQPTNLNKKSDIFKEFLIDLSEPLQFRYVMSYQSNVDICFQSQDTAYKYPFIMYYHHLSHRQVH